MTTTVPTKLIIQPNPRRAPFSWGNLFVHLLLALLSIACIVPMLLVISVSLSDERAIAREGYSLLPRGFTKVDRVETA